MPYLNDKILEEYLSIKTTGDEFGGKLDEDDPNVGVGFCTKDRYIVKLYLKIASGIIERAKFQAVSCTTIMATTNYTCRLIQGMRMVDALKITNWQIIKEFGMEEVKFKENVIVSECIKAAVNNYMDKNG